MTIGETPGCGEAPKRRGRPLSPICEETTPEHREWLVPLRAAYAESGLTYEQLRVRAVSNNGQLSRLLTGAEGYPDLARVLDVYTALVGVVEHTYSAEWYCKTWEAGAWAAGRPEEWIKECRAEVKRKRDAGRYRQAFFCLLGLIVCALLWTRVVMPDGTGRGGPPFTPVTSCAAVCGLTGQDPRPRPARNDRWYVMYPAPTPSALPTGPFARRAYVAGTVLEDAPVYDLYHQAREEQSKGVYVRAGSTVYVQCHDSRGYLVIYGGNGDRFRARDVANVSAEAAVGVGKPTSLLRSLLDAKECPALPN
ncbi:hypothetical protein AAW14_19055 [Streptomyces hygroscopicus]|uniref:hypothetical protein n=1 Tax=Streptomyces hygroscopicus TaxID=1912 RepID=UPI0022404529|nr:hypothetical protein [Streptomyces hygroscopicus]MCW7944075.1 hypothetical protein [Streptomyces hygroscopicus]